MLPTRSTRLADYDGKILLAMSKWVYSPYQVDSQSTAVCTGVTFVNSQR